MNLCGHVKFRTCLNFYKRAARCGVLLFLATICQNAFAAYTTLVNNGPSSNRVDVVFLGDGYTASDIAAGVYDEHVNNYIDYMFADTLNSDPFYRYRNFFNIHAIEVVSSESGADVPPQGIFRNTALDARYYGDGQTERLLTINTSKANTARSIALTGAPFTAEMQFATVNDTKYGGSGGAYAVFAGGNSFASEVALHEIAHSFSNLADEYGGNSETYTGSEPSEVNVTKNSSGAKWSHWLGYVQPGVGTIGAYEGGKYYDHGIYRPSPNSKMRSLLNPFDAVSREKIILDIYKRVNPFDSWSSNSIPLTNPSELAVDLVDDEIISVEWFVNNVLIPEATGTTFAPSDFGFGPGQYTVKARGYDPTAFDPVNGWVRKNQSELEQFVSWSVTLTDRLLVGDFDLDNDVDGRDFLMWQRNPSVGSLAQWQAGYDESPLVAGAEGDVLIGAEDGPAHLLAVPEPSVLVLLLPSFVGILRMRL